MNDRFGYMMTMFGQAGAGLADRQTMYLLMSNLTLLLIAILGSLSWVKRLVAGKWLPEGTARRELAEIVFMVLLFVACVALLVNSSYNPFLYFRF